MTVPAQATLFNESVANGVTTSFPYEFMIASADDLAVELDGVATTTGFTVTGVGDANGGDIVFSVPPANGVKVLRYLNSELSRSSDYQQFGDFNADVANLDFDRLWLALQSIGKSLARAIKMPISTVDDQKITASDSQRANKALKFDGFGNIALSNFDPDEAQQAGADALAAAEVAAQAANSASGSAAVALAAAEAAASNVTAAEVAAQAANSASGSAAVALAAAEAAASNATAAEVAAQAANSASGSAAAVALAAAEAAASNAMPTQAGNNGKFLKTDGSVASWDDPVPAGSVSSSKMADGAATGAKLGADVALKADIQAQTYKAFTTGGTGTAFTLTPSPAISALASGQEFDVTFHAAAGATPTLAISGLAAKSLKYRDSSGNKQSVNSTQIPSGWRSRVVYDGTDYIVREIPPATSASGLPTQAGNNGKFLKTDGSVASWDDPVPAGSVSSSKMADGAATGAKLGADVALKADIQAQTYKAFTTGGTGTAFTLTPSPAISALASGQEFDVTFHAAAGATPTLAISGLAAKSLKYRDSSGNKQSVNSTQIPSGWRSRVVYDGTDYIVREIPPATSASGLPTQAGNNGKFLKTDGSVASWDDPVPAGSVSSSKMADGAATGAKLGADVALKADIQAQTYKAFTTGGTGTAFTLTPSPAISALASGQEFDVTFHAAAGATPTLAISGLAAKSLKYRDSSGNKQSVNSTQIPSGWRSRVVYDGTDYIVREIPPATSASGLPTQAGNNGKFLKTDGSVASWDDPVPAGSVSSSKMADGAATGAKLGADVALKADIQAQTYKAFTTGGTGTAFTLTPSPAISALASGQEFDVTFHAAAGATPTLAISGLAAKSLKYRDSSGNKQSVNSTQIPSGWRSRVVYDGTDYIVREIPPATSASSLPTQAGNNGKFLKTDGSVASWDDPVPAGSVSSSKMADGAATGAKLGADVALKADIQAQTYKAFTTGGTGTAFTLTPSPAISALASGQEFDVTFHAAAGATPTLAISGLAAKSLKYRDSSGNKQSVNSTQIPSGWRSRVVYDGTDYIVREIPPATSASSLPTQAGNNGKFLKTDGSVASWDDPVPAGSVSSSKMADGAATGAKLGADVALKADIQAQTYKAFTTGGTGTAFTLTPSPAISALASGQEFDVTFHAAAGATPTLAISGLAAKSLKYRDSSGNKQSVNSTQIPSGWRSRVVYDGTDYIVREIPPATSTTLQNEGVGLIWGGALNLGATATYYAQGGGLAAQTVETFAQWPIPPLTRVSGLRVHLSAAPSAGSVVFTVRKNGVDTGITCTISSGQTGSDLAHSEDFLFGEMLSLKVQTSGLSPTTINFGFSIVTYDYNTGKGKCILPITMTSLGPPYQPTQALGAPGASRGLAYTNFLTPMPAMSFDTYLANAASFVRYIGGVSVPSDVGFAGSLFTPVVANNDTFAFNDSSASTTALYGSIVPKRHPDYSAPLTTYPPCLMMLTAYAQAQNTTRYFGGYVIHDAMTGAEGEIQIPMPPCTLNNLRANASAAFAAGQSNVVTVRKNGADTALTVTLDNANQKNSDTTHSVTFSSGDLFSLKSVTSATAGTKYYNASIEVLA